MREVEVIYIDSVIQVERMVGAKRRIQTANRIGCPPGVASEAKGFRITEIFF